MGEPVPEARGIATVLHTSVATLYSDLVTRPTGRAVRFAIDEQLRGIEGRCLSILDFSRVGIVDFSCADEVIAKLLLRYTAPDRPADAFFLVLGVHEHHHEPIDAVLRRHGLLLVTVGADGRRGLWGPTPERLRWAWECLEQLGRTCAEEFASVRGVSRRTAGSWLRRLASRRVAVSDGDGYVFSLPSMLDVKGSAGW